MTTEPKIKWVWGDYATMATTYALAKKNIQWQAFGKCKSVYRDRVDPKQA